MGSMSIWHWIIVAGIVMLLFGRGKISDLMGDVAKGIKAFKKGMAEDETPATTGRAAAERGRAGADAAASGRAGHRQHRCRRPQGRSEARNALSRVDGVTRRRHRGSGGGAATCDRAARR